MATSTEYILRGPACLYEPAAGGIGYELFRSLNLHKGKIAQQFINTGETDTYDALLVRCIRTAIYLRKRNLAREDIVCICSGNSFNSLVPYIATQFVGTKCTGMEPTIAEKDLIHFFNYIQPKIMFATEEIQKKIETCLKQSNSKCEIIILGNSLKFTTFSQLMVFSEEEKNFRPVFIEDLKGVAFIFLSSGTTGAPKGICCNHYALLAQIFNLMYIVHHKGTMNFSNFSYKFDDKEISKFMYYSPMYWVSGLWIAFGTIFCGSVGLVGTKFNAEKAWKCAEKHEPDSLFLPPGLANEFCFYATGKKTQPKIGTFLAGGGLVRTTLLENMWKSFPQSKVIQGYGQTENSGLIAAFKTFDPNEVELQKKYPKACGKLSPGMTVKIVDPDNGKDCGPGVQGEIRLKNEYIMNGYYKMDSSSAFDSNGWFKTGDLGYFDENGCIYVVDRLKDLLLYTQFNIRPSVIENILCQHPSVFEALVIGIPHPTDNELPMGLVILKEGYKKKVSADELTEFVNERVPSDRYKIRAGIKFLNEFIRTSTGKAKKVEMKRLVVEGKL